MNIIENIDKIKWNLYRKLSWKTVVWLEDHRLSLKRKLKLLRFKIKKARFNGDISIPIISPIISKYKIMILTMRLRNLPKEGVI
jgi:hypothetical protein